MKLFSRLTKKPDTAANTAIEPQVHVVTSLHGNGAELTFEAKNRGTEPARVCIFLTPFEGFRGDILSVEDAQGASMQYLGVQIKRTAPQDRHFTTILPGEVKQATFKLDAEYQLTGVAPYTVRFKGTPAVNGLADSNALVVTPT